MGGAALLLVIQLHSVGGSPAPVTDYMAMLGADDIQGKKSGFLAGNKAIQPRARLRLPDLVPRLEPSTVDATKRKPLAPWTFVLPHLASCHRVVRAAAQASYGPVER